MEDLSSILKDKKTEEGRKLKLKKDTEVQRRRSGMRVRARVLCVCVHVCTTLYNDHTNNNLSFFS